MLTSPIRFISIRYMIINFLELKYQNLSKFVRIMLFTLSVFRSCSNSSPDSGDQKSGTVTARMERILSSHSSLSPR